MKFLNELKALKLPPGEYAIFGSGPMAIRGIRDSRDIDIIVKKDLWENLLDKYPESLRDNPICLEVGNIEIYKDWMQLTDKIDEMIENAEMIESLPFVKLKYLIEWKMLYGREKDLKDVELINNYLKNNA